MHNNYSSLLGIVQLPCPQWGSLYLGMLQSWGPVQAPSQATAPGERFVAQPSTEVALAAKNLPFATQDGKSCLHSVGAQGINRTQEIWKKPRIGPGRL